VVDDRDPAGELVGLLRARNIGAGRRQAVSVNAASLLATR
jgi:hypothetical protein